VTITPELRGLLRSVAASAFDAGARSAPQPKAQRDRQRIDAQTYAEMMLVAQIEAAIERGSAGGAP